MFLKNQLQTIKRQMDGVIVPKRLLGMIFKWNIIIKAESCDQYHACSL